MNIVKRLGRYLRVLKNRGELQAPRNWGEALNLAGSFEGGFLDLMQIRYEIEKLLGQVAELKPRRVLEIGTAAGGTLYLWTRVAAEDAHLISVDLPGGPYGGGYSSLRIPIYKSFARARQRIDLVRASSHDASTLAHVSNLLRGEKLDYLYIDGDHSYRGALQDWEMYAPLVRSGGLIAFHDTLTDYHSERWGHVNVRQVWNEVKVHPSAAEAWEYTDPDEQAAFRYGIGVIRQA